MMPGETRVAILEDDPNRIAEMRACLSELLPTAQSVFFDNAQTMIAWLRENVAEVVLISLDHDLLLRNADGQSIDYGTGRQVVDYLISMTPTCPVIIHSSNQHAAIAMRFALKDEGWPTSQVFPNDEEGWIRAIWAEQVRTYALEGWFSG